MEEKTNDKDLIDLKLINELPVLYITNQLGDLKSQVDLFFTQQQVNKQESKQEWLQIIKLIEEYEKDCCEKANKNYIQNLSQLNLDISNKLINTNLDNELIQNKKFTRKIEKILFLNQTLIFLNRKKCENKLLLDENNEFKFVILKDAFISRQGIETLIKNSSYQIGDELNNEKLKLNLLKTKLINMSSQIEEVNLSVKELQDLDFYSFKLKSIHANTFCDFVNLTRLSLRDNCLSRIDSTTFHNLINLENLNLDDNQLNLLELDTFKGLINLRELSINSNKLNTIQVGLFNGLVNLNSIWCNRNNISELSDYTFKDLSNLKWLSLGFNQIRLIQSKAFYGLISLEELYIDNNKLKSVKSKLFNPLDNLQTLCLNKNPVTYSIRIFKFKIDMSRDKSDCKVYTHKNYFL